MRKNRRGSERNDGRARTDQGDSEIGPSCNGIRQRIVELLTSRGLTRYVAEVLDQDVANAIPLAESKGSEKLRHNRDMCRNRFDLSNVLMLFLSTVLLILTLYDCFGPNSALKRFEAVRRSSCCALQIERPFPVKESEPFFSKRDDAISNEKVAAVAARINPTPAPEGESDEDRVVQLMKMVCGGRQPIVLNMFPNARSGWGFLAMNIFVRLSMGGVFCPVLTDELEGEAFHTQYSLKSVFLTLYYNQEKLSREIQRFDKSLEFLNVPVFHAIPGTFDLDPGFWGVYNVGYLTVEQASFRDDEIARAKTYDFLFSPSSWNEEILRRHGFNNVATVLQGVELDMFPRHDGSLSPGVREYYERASQAWQNKFVVFSGGKMEFRKGQDIVIDAFRVFSERHPDALLVTLWYNRHKNMIPVVMNDFGIDSTEPPAIRSLLVSQGVREESVVPLPYVDQDVIVGTLLRADLALFTNRAEGATNLLALEAFASETPTIISNNTGHRDVVGLETDASPRCFPLNKQGPVLRRIGSYNGHLKEPLLEGWGESSLEEVLEKMEFVYAHPQEAREVAKRGAEFARSRTWESSTRELQAVLKEVVSRWRRRHGDLA